MKLIYDYKLGDFVFLDKNFNVVKYPTLFIRKTQQKDLKYSTHTIKQYSKVLLYFCSYLELTCPNVSVDGSISNLDGDVINNYLKFERNKGLALATIRNREVIIRELLTWLTTKEGGSVRSNNGYSSKRYFSAAPDKKLPKYLTTNEIIEFINLLHDESQKCLVHFLFDSGVRVSELLRVKLEDIPKLEDYPEDTVYFDLNIKGSKGRGGFVKERKTFITRALIQRINRLHRQQKVYKKARKKFGDDMPCFINVHGEVLTEGAIKSLLYDTAIRGNLNPSKFSAHKFRHSFAVHVLLSEFDSDYINKLVIVKEALGHKNIKTTEIYSNISPAAIKHLQKTNEKFNIFNRFEESQLIYETTYLPQKNHIEKRGRTNGK